MKFYVSAPLGAMLALAMAAPAAAQDATGTVDWSGPYVGGSLGYSWQPSNSDETIGFDTNGDGEFGDTVTTVGGADAFSPGFCNGAAQGATPASGCRNDKDGTHWSIHAGYDRQYGNIVAGLLLEAGKTHISNSVSAFSTTPANYVMTRSLDWNAALRARVGLATGRTLLYATGGVAYGRVQNSFDTTNGLNAFTETKRKESAWGWTAGGGVEQMVADNFSIGVLYKYTRYDAGDYRVNASQGAAPATNPFVITPAGSTDFARAGRFDNHAVKATASFRF